MRREGLIVFDTGRHPEHAKAIVDYASARHEPIAAVINSHWHLDHTTGNWDIRKAYPHVAVYASSAIDGALATFLKKSRAQDRLRTLADPKTSAVERDRVRTSNRGHRSSRAYPPRPHYRPLRENADRWARV